MAYHKSGNLLMKLAKAHGFNSRLCYMAKEKIQQQDIALNNLKEELAVRPTIKYVWLAVNIITGDSKIADDVIDHLREKQPYEIPEQTK